VFMLYILHMAGDMLVHVCGRTSFGCMKCMSIMIGLPTYIAYMRYHGTNY
jgi:hypothetical protein